jgi:DNA-binding transcriptional MerR regulator
MKIYNLMGGIFMNNNKTFSIGEISERTGISIRTLRYYDEIGLLVPQKNPTSGHRIYNHQDIQTLQKILSLKFLGYSLDNITALLQQSSFTVDLNDTLSLHLKALEEEKVQIEQSMNAIKRIIHLLKEEGEVESNLLLSLISGWHTEDIQKKWIDQHELTDVMKALSEKSEEEKNTLNQNFVQLSKELKQLYGKPVDDPKVQKMVAAYLEAAFSFLGEDLIHQLAEADVEEAELQEFEGMMPSPFTEDEQKWLDQAMGYYVKQAETT